MTLTCVLRKQRYTAKRIYERLAEEHEYIGSESSVRRIVADLRRVEKETYIPLKFEPGTNAQCDWGSGYVYLSEEYTEIPIVLHAYDQ